jgi:hypothetical protein
VSDRDVDTAVEARAALLESWDKMFKKLTADFFAQVTAAGHKPEWYYLASAEVVDGKLECRWALHPEIQEGLRAAYVEDDSAIHEAAKRLMARRDRALMS